MEKQLQVWALSAYFTKLVSVRVLHIPRGEEPYCSVIKTEHSSKLYWADLKYFGTYFIIMLVNYKLCRQSISSEHIGKT